MMTKIIRWLPAIFLCVLIFWFSSRRGTVVVSDYFWNYLSNKAAHLILYFTLCISFYRGTKNIVLAIFLSILYGITDELHQQFVPTRSGQIRDLVIDSVAAMMAGVFLWKFYQHLPVKLKNWLSY